MAIHDRQALKEYAQWIRTVPRERADEERELFFSPLLKSPRDPVASATAAWLFNDAQSPWNPITGTPKDKDYVSRFGRRFDAPLLVLPAFRRHLAGLLTDRRLAGRVTADGGQQQIELLVGGQWAQGSSSYCGAIPYPPPHARVEFRVCDWIAHELSELHGMPRCELYWQQAERDKAVVACAGLLRQYGERFQINGSGNIVISFAPFDHPAAPEDVAAGRAIFSLAGQGAVRVFPLPYLPTGAKWLALKDDATSQTALDPRTNQPTTVVSYDQDGVVWQAEEVQVGGTWKRYFGFVGRHCLAKVPAAEIDFSRDAGPSARIAGLDVVALEPGGSDDTLVGDSLPWIGGPLPVVVLVRNDTGLDRPLPRFVIDGAGVAKPRDSIGVRLSLSYADRQRGESLHRQFARFCQGGSGDKPPAWRELPRKPASFQLRSVDRDLKALETFQILKFDLRDYFQLAPAGWYRIAVTCDTGRKPPDEQPTATAEFWIDEKPVKPPKW